MASGRLAVVIVGVELLTTICKAWVSESPLSSVTLAVKWKVPFDFGVPVIAPPPLSVSPPGSAPAETEKEYGGFPPVAATVWE